MKESVSFMFPISKIAPIEITRVPIADYCLGYFRTTLVRDDALLADVASGLDWLTRQA